MKRLISFFMGSDEQKGSSAKVAKERLQILIAKKLWLKIAFFYNCHLFFFISKFFN